MFVLRQVAPPSGAMVQRYARTQKSQTFQHGDSGHQNRGATSPTRTDVRSDHEPLTHCAHPHAFKQDPCSTPRRRSHPSGALTRRGATPCVWNPLFLQVRGPGPVALGHQWRKVRLLSLTAVPRAVARLLVVSFHRSPTHTPPPVRLPGSFSTLIMVAYFLGPGDPSLCVRSGASRTLTPQPRSPPNGSTAHRTSVCMLLGVLLGSGGSCGLGVRVGVASGSETMPHGHHVKMWCNVCARACRVLVHHLRVHRATHQYPR